MADLVSGRFPQSGVPVLWYGTNTVNASYPARTNAEYLGLTLKDTSIATTGVLTAVPVPWDGGEVVTSISILTGATACSLPTHAFAAIYTSASTPALIAQSTDSTSVTAFAASTVYTIKLTNPTQVTPAQCAGGYIWAGFSITSTTQPTVSSGTSATAAFASTSAITTGAPLYMALTAGTSLAGSAAATIASPSAKADPPIVWVN